MASAHQRGPNGSTRSPRYDRKKVGIQIISFRVQKREGSKSPRRVELGAEIPQGLGVIEILRLSCDRWHPSGSHGAWRPSFT